MHDCGYIAGAEDIGNDVANVALNEGRALRYGVTVAGGQIIDDCDAEAVFQQHTGADAADISRTASDDDVGRGG